MAESTQTVYQSNVSKDLEPYLNRLLNDAEWLTDINANPYQSFGGQRTAGPTSLQNQSYAGAQFLRPSDQTGQAGSIAGAVAQQAGRAGQYTPGNFNAMGPMMTGTGQWSTQAAQQYMNPYQQGVTDIAKREAMRQSNMMGQAQNAQAVGAGAFGGSRHAIVDAERQRNLGTQLNDIQMQGANNAYTTGLQAFQSDQGRDLASQQGNQNAWSQYGAQNLQAQGMGESSRQFGANMGLQGLSQQLAAAGMLKDVGQSQYNQNVGILGLQNQFGTQQQATQQLGLDAQYQDWQSRQNWPYKNIEFMSNVVRGVPMTSGTQTMYAPSGNNAAQLLGGGLAAYSMLNGGGSGGMKFAEGGRVKASRGAGLADLLISKIQ